MTYSNPTPARRAMWKAAAKAGLTHNGRHAYDDPLAEKQGTFDAIARMQEEGQIGVYIWQMDCDCASWDYIAVLPAQLVRVIALLNSTYEGAEGPVRWHIVPPSEREEFRSSRRDHALEAFEDGHPHSVSY